MNRNSTSWWVSFSGGDTATTESNSKQNQQENPPKLETVSQPETSSKSGTEIKTESGSSPNNRVAMRRRNIKARSITISISDVPKDEYDGVREDPFYIALADTWFTLSGFTDAKQKEQKREILGMIQAMSGNFTKALTSRTTHVLVAHANTIKVKVARSKNIPVVTIEWFYNLYKACTTRWNPYLHVSQPEFKECTLPIFYNLRFIFSKELADGNRRYYEQLAKEHGGTITTDLTGSPASAHLYICNEPEEGSDFTMCVVRDIPCVSLSWISDSVFNKILSDVKEYEIVDFFEEALDECEDEDAVRYSRRRNKIGFRSYEGFDSVDDDVFSPDVPNKKTKLDWVDDIVQELFGDAGRSSSLEDQRHATLAQDESMEVDDSTDAVAG